MDEGEERLQTQEDCPRVAPSSLGRSEHLSGPREAYMAIQEPTITSDRQLINQSHSHHHPLDLRSKADTDFTSQMHATQKHLLLKDVNMTIQNDKSVNDHLNISNSFFNETGMIYGDYPPPQ